MSHFFHVFGHASLSVYKFVHQIGHFPSPPAGALSASPTGGLAIRAILSQEGTKTLGGDLIQSKGHGA